VLCEHLREIDLWFVVVVVRHVHEALCLLLERNYNAGMAVPQVSCCYTRDEIEILSAIGVVNLRTPALHEHDWLTTVGVHEVFV